jgi:NADPH-dependent curcumin reductase CurA
MKRTARTWKVARASKGLYEPDCFTLVEHEVPTLSENQVLIETKLLSLDPTHLNWIKLDPELQFLPISVGDAMLGTNIGIVRESTDPRHVVGQMVMGIWDWSTLAIASGNLIGPALPATEMPLTEQLTILSHVGQAAIGGVLGIGRVNANDAVLVSAAAGATGSIAAQIAKSLGCKVVGIAGGPDKCRYLIDELGLDGAIDYRVGVMASQIAHHFPDGVDFFFDNVGGETLDAVLANMAKGCRIAVCGAISQYDAQAQAHFTGIKNLPMLIFKQARLEGYVAGQFGDENCHFSAHLIELYKKGKLKTRPHVVVFSEIPETLTLLLTGKNKGKLMALID